jgi:hypothetical protein
MGWRNLCKEILNSWSSSTRMTSLITVDPEHKGITGGVVEVTDKPWPAGVRKIGIAVKPKS